MSFCAIVVFSSIGSPSLTLKVFFWPKRMTSMSTTSPGLKPRMIRCSVLVCSIGLPAAAMMMSPISMPAFCAGPFSTREAAHLGTADLRQARSARVRRSHMPQGNADNGAANLAELDQIIHYLLCELIGIAKP